MLQMHRRGRDCDLFRLANNSPEARQCEVTVADVRGGASVWDCGSGEIRPVASTEDAGSSRVQLAFEPHEAYWLVVRVDQYVVDSRELAIESFE